MDPMSLEAWRKVQPTLRTKAQRLFAYIEEHGPHTCDELEFLLTMPHQTVSAMLNIMMEAGLVFKTGSTRLTRYRRNANIWELESRRKEGRWLSDGGQAAYLAFQKERDA
jgi:DNA-binding IclR family transcriptional regulator